MLLCLRCAVTYEPAHALDDYCRVCSVIVKKAEYSRAYSKAQYAAIKADPVKKAAYNEYMRETMNHRRRQAREARQAQKEAV